MAETLHKRWVKYAGGALVLVALALAAAWGSRALLRPDLAAEAERAFATLNRHLPARVDAQTTLEEVTLDDRLITYHYALAGKRATTTDRAAFRTDLGQRLPAQVCGNESIRQFFEAGFRIRFRYLGEARGELGSFDFEPADCKQ